MRFASLLLLSGLMVAADGARAEDFTGFYAGINAGYAFGHEKDRRTGSFAPAETGESAADRSLPPSASNAARSMQSAPLRSGRTQR